MPDLLFYSMGCNPLLWLFIGGSNCPWFAHKEGFTLASVSCWGPPLFLVFFVIVFWRQQMCQAHLVISLLQPWNQPFLQGALVPFTGEWCSEARICAVDMFTEILMSEYLCPYFLSGQNEGRYVYTHIFLNIRAYLEI